MRGRQPSVDFIIRFCRALEVRVDWLLLGEGPQFPDELIDWAARSPEFPELLRRAFEPDDAEPEQERRRRGA